MKLSPPTSRIGVCVQFASEARCISSSDANTYPIEDTNRGSPTPNTIPTYEHLPMQRTVRKNLKASTSMLNTVIDRQLFTSRPIIAEKG